MLSQDLVHFLAENSERLKVYNSEDVSVGTWLAPLKLNRVHDIRFDTEYLLRGCNNKDLISHKQSIEDLNIKYKTLKERGVLCEKEIVYRPSYIYNWNVPPSQCCPRLKDNQLP